MSLSADLSHSDIDECQFLSTCANGICLNTEGSYTCENCPTGYGVSHDGEFCEGWFISSPHIIDSTLAAFVNNIFLGIKRLIPAASV